MARATVTDVVEYTVNSRSLSLSCTADIVATDAGEHSHPPLTQTLPIQITFYTPSTFRFEFSAYPASDQIDPRPSTTIPDHDPDPITTPVSLSVTETETELVAETDALTLRIGLDDWAFTVETTDGTVLTEQRGDSKKGIQRSNPLGFTSEQVAEWPYHVTTTGTGFECGPDEHFYGCGEKFTALDKRGDEITAWIRQPHGTATEHAYKNVPFYLSDAGYGLFVDTVAETTFDFGSNSTHTTEIQVADPTLSFVFFYGPAFTDIIEEYTALTGRPDRPPKWTFGMWMSRNTYETRDEIETVATRLRDEALPCDVLHFDPAWMGDDLASLDWDTDAFPNPSTMLDRLHEQGFHVSVWEFPYLQQGTDSFATAAANDYLVTDGYNRPYLLRQLTGGGEGCGAILDFTNPDAAAWWREKHERLLEMGVDVFKTDFGEYIPTDAVFANGQRGSQMRNQYPFLYHQTVADAFDAPESPVLWARAGWAGGQQYPIHWGGDPDSTFAGFAASLRGGLSLCLSGYQFWSADCGGYSGTPSPELYIRWGQYGLLGMSHPRFHGKTPREPWHYGEQAVAIIRKFARERYRLLPYIYSYAEQAARTGLPVMRPLILEYQDDPTVKSLATQQLLGEELLIAPVLSADGTVSVYLPETESEWVDYWTGTRYAGGQWLDWTVPLDEMPVFVRANSIIPTREPPLHLSQDTTTPDTLTFEVRPRTDAPTDATFDAYDSAMDELVPIRARLDAAQTTVTLEIGASDSSPASRSWFPQQSAVLVEIASVETPPETVTINGDSVPHADGSAETAEAGGDDSQTPERYWWYDADAETLHIVVAGDEQPAAR